MTGNGTAIGREGSTDEDAGDAKSGGPQPRRQNDGLSLQGATGGLANSILVRFFQYSTRHLREWAVVGQVSQRWRRCSMAPAALACVNVNSRFTDTTCAHAARLLGLRHVYVRGSRVTDVGVASLAALSGLQSLNLSGCGKITDTGVASLAALSGLQSLDLSWCGKITDTGVASLAALSGLPSLQWRYWG
jgi:hypothetical protein